ncbi:PREDICTED: uncharacterized protein LOC104811939 [Tarenaya hassleriana]|uniref:uncharacterized protein LOC104811939 n=1 Tax=Tarenaya hassleriana TaxID=28532 RepID=UPI00053C4520|nr:PREDICTED: uncharacterized protein LOC104811939 [Tarenaya hassleriana]
MNQESGSPTTLKRKRGRPRKDETQTQQEKTAITPRPDTVSTDGTVDDIMGQVVSGVVEGSFDAGYFLNVKVADTDKQLRGVVFIPNKVTPITAENDVAPHVKMYEREEISAPSSNPKTHPQGQENSEKPTDNDTVHELQTGIGSELRCSSPVIPSGMQVKDIDNASLLERVPPPEIADSGYENQALSLMPQSGNDGFYETHNTVPACEASEASKKSSPDRLPQNDSVTEGNPLVDFFPTSETTRLQSPNLEFFHRETKLSSRDERQKSPPRDEPRGFNLMAEKPAPSTMENVPEEELQLELGNKIMSGVKPPHPDSTGETNHQRASSMSGFLANLFEGEATRAEPDPAAPESGLGTVPEEDDSSAIYRNVDCNMKEDISKEQTQKPLVSD